jgi:hypothetical protein
MMNDAFNRLVKGLTVMHCHGIDTGAALGEQMVSGSPSDIDLLTAWTQKASQESLLQVSPAGMPPV